ncbi:hypothetical protein BCON_0104g00380 [Botryotinia convoluta]|uniref:Uncharacterized protein n=1 Tax=Botryotinia convoluta TaxID=54673 RepID=A0A4Z1HZQ7_9HELO|nr:hypothetical protein BCON_0104g00380 [Botryotinia convoluta]
MTFSIFKRREGHDHDHDHEESAKSNPNTSPLPRYSTNNSLSQPPPPYSPNPHPPIPSEAHPSPAHLSELTIDYIPGTIFNAFKTTLLIYDSPRYPNTKSLPIFKMTIEGMKRITSMYIYSGSIKNEDRKEEVMLGGAQFDKFNRKIEVQQLGIEGVQRELESGMEYFGGGKGREKEGRYEWRLSRGGEGGKGKAKEEDKERILVWQQKIPSTTQKLSFSNPNAELRDRESGDLYAVMIYDVFAGKDMMGIQYRGGIDGESEEEKRGFQMGVLITGCVVVERERQRIGRRGTIGIGLGIGMASG